jgi:glycosyltransferase involved in cell wall biosynthesis
MTESSRQHRILKLFDWHEFNAEAENCRVMAKRLSLLGVDVTLMCSEREPALTELKKWDGPTVVVPGLGSKKNPHAWRRATEAIATEVRKRNIGIIHPYRSSVHALSVFAKRKSACVKLVRTRGTDDPPKKTVLNRYLYSRATDMTVVSSKRAAERFVRFGLASENKLAVVYGGVDISPFSQTSDRSLWRHRLELPDDAAIVVMLARFAPVKGHECALSAFAGIAERFTNARLVCVGVEWGDTLTKLEKHAANLGVLDRVIFVPRWIDDVPELLSVADVGLLSSVGSEGMSRACLEYMAASLPVVATRVGVLPEVVVEGETGRLVKPHDVSAMTAALDEVLSDANRRVRWGRAGRSRVERCFTLEREARAVRSVYDRVSGCTTSGREVL